MIYVVDRDSMQVLNRIDAWVVDGIERMVAWAWNNGFEEVSREITIMGNMVIWVQKQ